MLIAVSRATGQVENGKSSAVRECPVLDALELDAPYVGGYDGNTNTRRDQADDRGGLQDFARNARPEACVGAQVRDLPVQARAGLAWIHDEGLSLQLTERQRRAARERVLFLYCHIQRAELACLGAARLDFGRLRQRENCAGTLLKLLTRLGQKHVAFVALEQLGADFVLECLDLLATSCGTRPPSAAATSGSG